MRIVFNEKMGSAEISAPSLKMFLKTHCDMGIKKHVQIGITFISGGLMKGAIKKKRFGPRWKSKLIVILQFESGHSKRKNLSCSSRRAKGCVLLTSLVWYIMFYYWLMSSQLTIFNFSFSIYLCSSEQQKLAT